MIEYKVVPDGGGAKTRTGQKIIKNIQQDRYKLDHRIYFHPSIRHFISQLEASPYLTLCT